MSSGITRASPALCKADTMRAAMYGRMSPSRATNLVKGTRLASPLAISCKKVRAGPFL